MHLVLLIGELRAVHTALLYFYFNLHLGFKDWFQRNFLSVLYSSESNDGHLWWYNYVLYYWLLPATTFSIVFATLTMQSAH
jgi:hypothetical protein